MGEIRDLLSSWSGHIEEASVIFIRTPKYGKGVFVGTGSSNGGGNAPFSRTDPRLRSIPFATRRPTIKEVQNVHFKLAAVYEVSSDLLLQGGNQTPIMKPKKHDNDTKKDGEFEKGEVAGVLPHEVGRPEEVELCGISSDEEERENNDDVGGATETTVKKKKKRRAKKTTEPQGW